MSGMTDSARSLGECRRTADPTIDADFGERADGKAWCSQCESLVVKQCGKPLCKGPATPPPRFLYLVRDEAPARDIDNETRMERAAAEAARKAALTALDQNGSAINAVRQAANEAARLNDLEPLDIIGPGRTKMVARVRKAVVLAVRRKRGMSFYALGRHLNGRTHWSIIDLHRTAEHLEKRDPDFAELVARLEAVL